MKTRVYPPTGVHGFGRSRTVGVITRPLTLRDAQALVEQLHDLGIEITARPGTTVHLCGLAPLTTTQEVRVLRAFAARTDAPLAWHGAVA